MQTSKVLVFGIDGATFDIIEPAIEKGKLPNLKSLMDAGCRARLTSTLHPITPMAWTSFATGTNAGKHGIFDFSRMTDGKVMLNSSLERGMPALWTYLTRAGKSSIVVNVPFTYPPEKIQGIMIPGFEAPQVSRNVFHPVEIYDEMIDRFGRYEFDWTFPIGQKLDLEKYLSHIRRTIDHRGETGLYLLEKHPWDFFMTVFSTPDHIQHIFWQYPNGQKIIEDVYAQCDYWLGEFQSAIDDDTTVMIMSDHGFGPIRSVIYLDNWLEQEGLLARPSFSLKQSAIKTTKDMLRRILPTRLRKWVAWRLADVKGRLEAAGHAASLDWAKTQAFSYGMYGNIYVNLKGRQPLGIVEPSDYDRLCEQISNKLLELSDPKTGETVVEKVHRKEDLYHGAHVNSAPDLVVQWRDYAYYTKRGLDRGNEIFTDDLMIEASEYPHTGTHRLEGVFIAKGPNIQSGRQIEAHITDLAPTILHLLGQPIPEIMDGRLLEELFVSPCAPTKQESKPADDSSAGSMKKPVQLSEEEEASVRDRLRSLGYIE